METDLIITNILHTGTAFAVRADDMTQNVFVPAKHAVNAGLKPGMRICATIVPNVGHGDKTPWIVVALEGAEPLPQTSLADRIRDELANGAATAYELAKFIGADVTEVEAELRRMKLPHTDLWALEMADLLQVAS